MRRLIRGLELVVTALMAVVTALVIAEVGLRNLFAMSLIITDELSRSLMVWTALLAAALLVHEDGHVRITVLTDALPPAVATVLYVVAQLVVLFFLALLVVSSLALMPSVAEQNTITLGVSIAWFYAALPVAGGLMLLFTVINLVVRLSHRRRAE
jgi:TRAP-type C4-dicarboxylate transport system permease small subunit